MAAGTAGTAGRAGSEPPPPPVLDLTQDEEAEHTGEQPSDGTGQDVASEGHPDRVEDRDERARGDLRAGAEPRRPRRPFLRPARPLWRAGYSHSIVPGGLLVMSSTTRLTSRISLIMREAIRSSRSYGSRAQSAVIASSDVTA